MTLTILGALLIGLSLGLLGSGGSILTVPVLVYLVGESGDLAVVESLAIVGLIALIGTVPYLGSAASMFGRCCCSAFRPARHLAGHAAQPPDAGGAATADLCRGDADRRAADVQAHAGQTAAQPRRGWQVALVGLGVGVLTGVVGVGGGFLILPALVLLLGLSMARSVGTSLVIIALNSALGFAFMSSARMQRCTGP